ncbi:hypothetical protein M378DRAFT_177981 [Amanita muscaria Koide BX008]|uniref:Uncharacterized protein n=1 Tax=Amanita muscaria (strain Koide BX008) TaxID=946122 RepID=A0A0C2XB27_AMAMK|nr:hypothetical protein M378DRAFT_177981 [Amanita muscaria Koide BX008]
MIPSQSDHALATADEASTYSRPVRTWPLEAASTEYLTTAASEPVPPSEYIGRRWYTPLQGQSLQRPADGVPSRPESTRRESTYVPVPPSWGVPSQLEPTRQESTYVPVPPSWTYVELPFEQPIRVSDPRWNQVFPSSNQEGHLAQTATYQQQQDLVRYMRELNEWLARVVNGRQDELNAVNTRLDFLTSVLLNLGRRPETSDDKNKENASQQHPHFTTEISMPQTPPRSVPQPLLTMDSITPFIHAPPSISPVYSQPPPPILSTVTAPPPLFAPVIGRSPRRDNSSPRPFIPPLSDAPHRPDDGLVHESATSSDSSSLDSTKSGELVDTKRSRRTRRDEPSRILTVPPVPPVHPGPPFPYPVIGRLPPGFVITHLTDVPHPPGDDLVHGSETSTDSSSFDLTETRRSRRTRRDEPSRSSRHCARSSTLLPHPPQQQPFSTQPPLYMPPSRRPSVRQSPRAGEPDPGQDATEVPSDEEECYRGQPTVQEPTSRPSTRTTLDFVPSRRPLGRTSLRAMSDAPEFIPPRRRSRTTLESIESIPTDMVPPLDLRQVEDRLELVFRQNEDRLCVFLENQEKRDQEARDRTERLLEAIDSRLASLVPLMPAQPPPPSPSEAVSEKPEAVVGDAQSLIDSVRTAFQEAAIQYSRDIQETIKAEREEFAREKEIAAAERDRLLKQAEPESSRSAEEREARIRELEEQVALMKQGLEDEKVNRGG